MRWGAQGRILSFCLDPCQRTRCSRLRCFTKASGGAAQLSVWDKGAGGHYEVGPGRQGPTLLLCLEHALLCLEHVSSLLPRKQ